MSENIKAVEGTMIGTLIGLAVHYGALIPLIPGWLVQAVVTISVGAVSIAVNRLVNRWMDQRWPERRRRRVRGDSRDTGE